MIGGVVAVLLLAIPLIVVTAMLASGSVNWGAFACLGLLFACGVAAVVSLLSDAGKTAALTAFARVNNLELTVGQAVPHYKGSLFAGQSHTVHVSVRTREADFVEVGTYWDISPRTVSHSSYMPGGIRVNPGQTDRLVFLRARLAGVARPPDAGELTGGGLDERLREFAGRYWIEVSGDELTLFGSKKLETSDAGHVEAAFTFADELVTRANAALVTAPGVHPAASDADSGKRPSALVTVALTLAFLIVGPIVIAVVMSTLDDYIHGNEALAQLAVYLMITVMFAVMSALLRFVSKRHRRPSERTRKIVRALGILTGVAVVGFIALIAVGIYLSAQDDAANAQRNADWERQEAAKSVRLSRRAVAPADRFLRLVNAGKKKAAIGTTCDPKDDLLYDQAITAAIKDKAKLKATATPDPLADEGYVNVTVTGTAHGKPGATGKVGMQAKDHGKTWCANTFDYKGP